MSVGEVNEMKRLNAELPVQVISSEIVRRLLLGNGKSNYVHWLLMSTSGLNDYNHMCHR